MGLWCGGEPAGTLGGCLDNRQGRKMCRSGGYGYIKPVHIATPALQTALERSCSAEEPVHSIVSLKESERGQPRRLSVLYTCKSCSELRLGSGLFITSLCGAGPGCDVPGWLGMYGYSYGNQLFQTPSCVQAVLLLPCENQG